jgi:hypothetical protein
MHPADAAPMNGNAATEMRRSSSEGQDSSMKRCDTAASSAFGSRQGSTLFASTTPAASCTEPFSASAPPADVVPVSGPSRPAPLAPAPRDLAVLPEQFSFILGTWIDNSVDVAQASGCHHRDIFTLRQRAPMSLAAFAHRVFAFSACDTTCFTVALCLIRRLRVTPAPVHDAPCRVPSRNATFTAEDACPFSGSMVGLTQFNVHRIIAAAVTIAIKSTQDVYHPMTYYGSVFGVTASDLRRMESALMALLDHRLFVSRAEAEAVVALLE